MNFPRTLVLNRFVLAAVALVTIVCAVNFYVVLHDDGILRGRVSDEAGRPVADAEVILYMPALIGLDEIARQQTDDGGHFVFRNHGQHHPALQISAEGFKKSDLERVRLYFRNQNRSLEKPIVIEADTNEG